MLQENQGDDSDIATGKALSPREFFECVGILLGWPIEPDDWAEYLGTSHTPD